MMLINKNGDVIHLDLDDDIEHQSNSKKETQKGSQKSSSYFSIDYWQTYFEINQYELYDRLRILVDVQKMNIYDSIKQKPELYGPFWIATSLIFCLFICGNLSGSG